MPEEQQNAVFQEEVVRMGYQGTERPEFWAMLAALARDHLLFGLLGLQ